MPAPVLSVVIPVHNSAADLRRCLGALAHSRVPPAEIVVVDDGSTDNPAAVCQEFGVTLVTSPRRSGSAHARNLGVASASGDVVLFLDADVTVHPDSIERVRDAFESGPDLDGVIGSYDDSPGAPNFCSQYRNLLHSFVHHTSHRRATTFWSGCGAIRRSVFEKLGGFDEYYDRPSIEDIEFGYRLHRAGHEVALIPDIEVTHWKRWTFWQMVRTDIFDRGIPWTELILREHRAPNDLNVKLGQRVSVALVYLLVTLIALTAYYWTAWDIPETAGVVAILVGILALNRDFYGFLLKKRGWLFLLRAIPLHLLYHFYNGFSFCVGVLKLAVRKRPRPAKRGADRMEPSRRSGAVR